MNRNWLLAGLCLVVVAPWTVPQRATGQEADQAATPVPREQRIAEYLNDCKFVGRFTVDSKPDATPSAEEYTIRKCEQLPAKDTYRLTTRIAYGDVDSELPIDVKILWAGETPVITLDSVWIPGMGSFSARVLIHNGRYSGTWQHTERDNNRGGHLFGKIVKE